MIEGEVGKGEIKINTSGDPVGGEAAKDEDLVKLSFALRYLNLFNKAHNLSPNVRLMMAHDTPLVVEYTIGHDDSIGSLKYYLAPKIND